MRLSLYALVFLSLCVTSCTTPSHVDSSLVSLDVEPVLTSPRPAFQNAPRLPTPPRHQPHHFEPTGFSSLGQHASALASVSGQPPVAIQSLSTSHTIHAPLASTQIHSVFTNHTRWAAEAAYTLALPPYAASGRLSMQVEHTLVEGELVPTHRAETIYEGIVRRRKDPALTQFLSPTALHTRLFPVVSQSSKKILHEYDSIMPFVDGAYIYSFQTPLPQETHVRSTSLNLQTDLDVPKGSVLLTSSAPDAHVLNPLPSSTSHTAQTFALRIPAPDQATLWTASAHRETYILLDLPYTSLNLPSQPKIQRPATILLVDTSASIGSTSLRHTRTLIQNLAPMLQTPPHLITGSITPTACKGPRPFSAPTPRALQSCLDLIQPRGASNLNALLQSALNYAKHLQTPANIVLFSDGNPSFSNTISSTLDTPLIRSLRDTSSVLHIVPTGVRPDFSTLARLSSSGGGTFHFDSPGSPALLQALRTLPPTPSPQPLSIRSTHALRDIQLVQASHSLTSQGRLTLLARVRSNIRLRDIGLKLVAHGKDSRKEYTFRLPQSAQISPAVERLWAVAHERDQPARTLSTLHTSAVKHGALLPNMSFLVLETQEAFDRFSIPRVQDQRRRKAPQHPPDLTSFKQRSDTQPSDPHPHREISGSEREPTTAPKISGSSARVSGSLDKTIIRRAIRRIKPKISRCFQERSSFRPKLSGRVHVQFTVAPTGHISALQTDSAFLDDLWARWCIQEAFSTLRFPSSHHIGEFTVNYPLIVDASTGTALKVLSPKEVLRDARLWSSAAMTATLHTLLTEGDTQAAEKAYQAFAQHLSKGRIDLDLAMLPILSSTERISTHWDVRLRRAMILHLRSPNPSEIVLHGFIHREQSSQGWPRTAEALQTLPIDPDLLLTLTRWTVEEHPHIASSFLERAYNDPSTTRKAIADLFVQHPKLQRRAPALYLDALLRNTSPKDLSTTQVRDLIRHANALQRVPEAASLLRVRCASPERDLNVCIQWFAALSKAPGTDETLRTLRLGYARELYALRSQTPGDLSSLYALSSILFDLGQPRESAEILSEVLEFHPHDDTARTEVFQTLLGRKEVSLACTLLAHTASIAPRSRHTIDMLAALFTSSIISRAQQRTCLDRFLDVASSPRGSSSVVVVVFDAFQGAREIHAEDTRNMVATQRSTRGRVHVLDLRTLPNTFRVVSDGLFAPASSARGRVFALNSRDPMGYVHETAFTFSEVSLTRKTHTTKIDVKDHTLTIK